MLTINAIRQTARGTPIWQPGAINLHVSVPCPLKVRLKEALGLVDVRVLDHVIVAGNSTASFDERGLI